MYFIYVRKRAVCQITRNEDPKNINAVSILKTMFRNNNYVLTGCFYRPLMRSALI